MHNHAHGLIPNQIMEDESHLAEAFLGRIKDPQLQGKLSDTNLPVFKDSAFCAIMVVNVEKEVPEITLYP